jgi:DNA-binding XRE family transcriptional regulator
MNGLELKRIRKELGLNQAGMAEKIGVGTRAFQYWEKDQRKIPMATSSFIKNLINNEQKTLKDEKEIIINEKSGKVPYFDIDVTSHITHSFNDVHETPSFYVDYKPFNDCAAYVNNYGDSMFPKYKNGERLAVKQIFNLDVINWGETYLIITNENANDLKTVKDIHPHKDLDKIILRASNPAYAGDTVINKEDVLSLFAIKGKISQNFI